MATPTRTVARAPRAPRARHAPPPRLRPARRPRHSLARPRRSVPLTMLTGLVVLYTLVPLLWLVISATKSQEGLADSFGLWFGGDFSLWDNVRETFTYNDGVFTRWLLNTLVYVVLGAGGATVLAVLGGYALAKFDFPGKRVVFAVVIGAVAVPGTALAVPTFLMFGAPDLAMTQFSVETLTVFIYVLVFRHFRNLGGLSPRLPTAYSLLPCFPASLRVRFAGAGVGGHHVAERVRRRVVKGDVLLDRRGVAVADPHEDEALERAGRVGLRLRARLAAHG